MCIVKAGVSVAEAFADDLDRDAGHDQQRGVGVAEVVEPDPRQRRRALHDPVEELADRLGVEEPARGVGEHPVVGAVGESVAVEPASPLGEDAHRAVVDVDASPAGSGLDVELDGVAGQVLQRPRDGEPLGGPVEVGPLEPDDLTAAHPGIGREVQRRVQALRPGGLQGIEPSSWAVQERARTRVGRCRRAWVAWATLWSRS